jgi:phage terminase Nu1 subunit (DNA packaging protein)
MPDSPPVTVSTLGALAEVFGVTIKTVQRWKGRHGMPVEADGSYHVGKIAKWQTESSLTPELRKYRRWRKGKAEARRKPPAAKAEEKPRESDAQFAAPSRVKEEENGGPDERLVDDPAYWDMYFRKYKALTAELEYRKARGEVAPIEEMRRAWERQVVEAKTILEGLPERLLLILPAEARGPARGQVEAEVSRTLQALAGEEG